MPKENNGLPNKLLDAQQLLENLERLPPESRMYVAGAIAMALARGQTDKTS